MDQMQTGTASVKADFDETFRPFIQDIFGIDTVSKQSVYAAFYRQYRAFVVSELGKRNKLARNFEDLEAAMWVEFSRAQLVEKFFEQAMDSMPETMTATQAVEFLGLHLAHKDLDREEAFARAWKRFSTAVWYYSKGKKHSTGPRSVGRDQMRWVPQPIEGSPMSKSAVYKTEDLVRFSDSGYFRKQGQIQLPEARASKKHFVNYLKRSISYRFANFCRYEFRRNKERVWDTFAELRPVERDESPASTTWEIEVGSDQESKAELGLVVRNLARTPASAYAEAIIISMYDEGYSLRDAINKVEGLTAEEKRMTIREVCDRRRRLAPATMVA